MKQYVVLFVGFIMLVKPLWPVAEYIINYNYIKNVLCENLDKPMLNCDGKCYLAKQLAKESQQDQENPFGEKKTKTETLTSLFLETLPQIDFGINIHLLQSKNFGIAQVFIPTLLTSDISQPPELA
ncbi:hypothetical protein QSE00_05550 [Arenibacter sp. M-2]|uniref:hypothetical protein n=1 Tax=Arenibacter sp. M-2 TaxID=3053612 RepID=UPI0025707B9F|nr:hypothetical protein [Arenibacter sp. M-2]MDL5511268.1 hypothetical protein [Arenibacter sp. M-2]